MKWRDKVSFSRIYQPIHLAPLTTVQLDSDASHHLARVLRAKVGDGLILFNGQGGEYTAVITHIDKKRVEVNVLDFIPRDVESPIQIQLAQGIARGEKMDFIVQKAVELGVTKIIPLVTERCNVRLDKEREEKRLQHWQGVIISACEQSGRNAVPQLATATALDQWLASVPSSAYRFVLSPHVEKKLPVDVISAHSTIVLLIGPEGGLSDAEVALAIKNGFMPLNLGPRVLRTETATIAAIAALQARYGDFSD
jgi:16S rRNA (uracil1498-N3)-methyltransferase